MLPLHLYPLCFLRHSLLYVQLEIDPLRDLALSEILSKITSVNIVNEFFPAVGVSFSYKTTNIIICSCIAGNRGRDIMRMQRELLSDKFCDGNTKTFAIGLIKSA